MTGSTHGAKVIGRRDERRVLDDLLRGAREGRSTALVLRGEAGIGKTELLTYVLERSTGCRTVRAVGVRSEIGARLFLSPHTVDWHLRKVFSKLGIASRKEMPNVLPQGALTSPTGSGG